MSTRLANLNLDAELRLALPASARRQAPTGASFEVPDHPPQARAASDRVPSVEAWAEPEPDDSRARAEAEGRVLETGLVLPPEEPLQPPSPEGLRADVGRLGLELRLSGIGLD